MDLVIEEPVCPLLSKFYRNVSIIDFIYLMDHKALTHTHRGRERERDNMIIYSIYWLTSQMLTAVRSGSGSHWNQETGTQYPWTSYYLDSVISHLSCCMRRNSVILSTFSSLSPFLPLFFPVCLLPFLPSPLICILFLVFPLYMTFLSKAAEIFYHKYSIKTWCGTKKTREKCDMKLRGKKK